MKKLTFALTGTLALAALFPGRAGAVWAPSTSLERRQSQATREELQDAARKLREDERRLDEAMTELKKDQAELRNLLGEGEDHK